MHLKYWAFANGPKWVEGGLCVTFVVTSFNLDIYKWYGSSVKILLFSADIFLMKMSYFSC